jgi:hypothetical protein
VLTRRCTDCLRCPRTSAIACNVIPARRARCSNASDTSGATRRNPAQSGVDFEGGGEPRAFVGLAGVDEVADAFGDEVEQFAAELDQLGVCQHRLTSRERGKVGAA